MPVEDIDSARIERWRAALPSTLSPRTRNKLLIQLHGIFRRAQKVYGLPRNLMVDVERHRQRSNGDIQVFSVEEVHGLVRAAESQQDAAPFLDGSALRRRYD
jgi:integrase